jgi:hypothetical protein
MNVPDSLFAVPAEIIDGPPFDAWNMQFIAVIVPVDALFKDG